VNKADHNSPAFLVQIIPLAAMVLGLLPLHLVAVLDVKKLLSWKLVNESASSDDESVRDSLLGASEPMPRANDGSFAIVGIRTVDEGPRSTSVEAERSTNAAHMPTGHDVLEQECAMAHGPLGFGQGLFAEGDALAQTHQPHD
jgi:hypothetical protein